MYMYTAYWSPQVPPHTEAEVVYQGSVTCVIQFYIFGKNIQEQAQSYGCKFSVKLIFPIKMLLKDWFSCFPRMTKDHSTQKVFE